MGLKVPTPRDVYERRAMLAAWGHAWDLCLKCNEDPRRYLTEPPVYMSERAIPQPDMAQSIRDRALTESNSFLDSIEKDVYGTVTAPDA